jgi:hypothetical protein
MKESEPSNTTEQIQESTIIPSSTVHSATGPRTDSGKQTASRNATKHGVFSKVILLKGESKGEYEELLARLREDLQPVGALEELLVEKLATITWRQRRLLLAEGAEIQKNREFVEWDQRSSEYEAAKKSTESLILFNNGLIQKVDNPDVLERCLELLWELRKQIAKNGLNQKNDSFLLEKIYGERKGYRLSEDLYDSYWKWFSTSETPEEEREREGYASPAQCYKNVLDEIDKEILRLSSYQKKRALVETERMQLEVVSRSIPDGPGLERLLRYEVSLNRDFDRTLSQLERTQRMRLGQPVAPRLELDVK